jgi:D-3-phosphoglycerate dehydrogenase
MTPPKRVVRFPFFVDPVFEQRLAAEPGVEVRCVPMPPDEDGMVHALAGAQVYHIHSAKDELPQHGYVTARLLERCPALVAVSTYGAGYDTVDVPACTRAGVLVMNQAGGNAPSVAEHAMGLLLSVSRRIAESDRALRAGYDGMRESLQGREVANKVLGIVGIGHIGTRMARLAHAFDMKVIATDPYVASGDIRRRGAEPVSFDELLARADVVSLHCPRDRDTLRMMDARAFARMKRGAIFLTTARGGIHDEQALEAALRSGHLSGAGLDVWDREPPPRGHPLFAHAGVVATFHTAGVTPEARRNIAAIGAEQIAALFRGERPARLVNPEVWDTFQLRRTA